MSKQLNINLGFTADTSQAKAQIQSLQTQLNSLIMPNGKNFSQGLNQEITKTLSKVTDLKIALSDSINPQTGLLNLNKFNQHLKLSGMSIEEYAQHLYSLGPKGQQAFSQLAQSINSASIPLKQSSALLMKFGTTLKNTISWQISSSLIHGSMGTIQSAFRYSEDLNKSLNEIRIVTNANTDEMARFAEQANRAAKALSATTTDYTKASLIYYQQGLSDQAVKERADITIKMANASGQSAEIVSDQMTAVWNNFAKGGEDLEHFADVMVRLGADTASSSEEIAQGLEKFAAIGDMVGLSYDNAAAALATVTATTRQSADVVGTAFKTIFARIQGLKLGGTLEDGTDLNKYSEALMSVGISIKEQNGELKDMDNILAEMGAKWTTLSKDQQVALAQTVAGVRQYNQLVALMENWDFYEENIERAKGSEGSLQRQANIYAESWEAADKRVKAAAEDIYDSLINDEFFIKLTDGFGDFLNIIENTIQGIGGIKGALLLLGNIITRVFSQSLAGSFDRLFYNLQTKTAKGQQKLADEAIRLKEQSNAALRNFSADGSFSGAFRADVNIQQANVQEQLTIKSQELLRNGKQLSEIEQKKVGLMLDQVRVLGDQVIATADLKDKSEKASAALERQIKNRIALGSGGTQSNSYNLVKNKLEEGKQLFTETAIGENLLRKFESQLTGKSDKGVTLKNFQTQLIELEENAKKTGVEINNLSKIFDKLRKADFTKGGAKAFFDMFETELVEMSGKAEQAFMDVLIEAEKLEQAGAISPAGLEQIRAALDQLQNEYRETGGLTEESIAKFKNLEHQVRMTGEEIERMKGRIHTMGDGIVALANIFSSVGMAITSIQGLARVWSDEDATAGEKMLSLFTTLGMVIPMVTMAFRKQNIEQLRTLAGAVLMIPAFKGLATSETQAAMATDKVTASIIGAKLSMTDIYIVLGLILLAVVALTATILIITHAITAEGKAAEKAAKAMAEQNKKTEELKENIKGLVDENKNLIDTFNEQRAAGEDTSQIYEDLSNNIQKLQDKYKQLGIEQVTLDMLDQAAAVGLATGDWDTYYKAVEKAGKEEKKIIGKQKTANVQAQLAAANAAFRKGAGSKDDSFTKGNVSRLITADSNRNTGKDLTAQKIVSQYGKDIYETKWVSGKDSDKLSDNYIFDTSNVYTFMKQYEQAQQVLNELAIDGLTNTAYYTSLKEEVDNMAEAVGEIEGSLEEASKYAIGNKFEDWGIAPEAMSSLDAYSMAVQRITNEMKDYFGSEERAREEAQKYLKTFTNNAEAASAYDFVERFGRKLNESVNLTRNENTKEIEIKPRYNEDEAQAQLDEMYKYINSLSSEGKTLAMKVDLEYINSVEEFKESLEDIKEFEMRVKVKGDPNSVIDTAKDIREDLQDIMSDYKNQGYLTTSQAVSFIEEHPEYQDYLVKTSKGYGLMQEAIDEFNGALKQQKKALEEIVNPTNIGGSALYDFGQKLISLKQSTDDIGVKNFISDIQELTLQFIEGSIKADDYFNKLNDNINNLPEISSSQEILNFANNIMPNIVKGIDKYIKAIDTAFEAGKIGAIEYRKVILQAGKTMDNLYSQTIKNIQSQDEFNKLKEENGRWVAEDPANEKANDLARSLNNAAEAQKKLNDAMQVMIDFEGINTAATEYYDELQQIFDEDFSVEVGIDDSELQNLVTKTEGYRKEIAEEFAKLGNDAKKNVVNKILEIGETMEDVVIPKAYEMSEKTSNSLTTIGVEAKKVDTNVEKAALDMLNGTYVASVENTQLTTAAMKAILKSGADTTTKLAVAIDGVFQGLRTMIDNFEADITFQPEKIKGKGLTIDGPGPFNFTIPAFKLNISGGLAGKSAEGLEQMLTGLEGLADVTLGDSSGGMSSFKPEGYVGNSSEIELDEDLKTGKDKDKKDKRKEKLKEYDDPSLIKPWIPEDNNTAEEIDRYQVINSLLEIMETNLSKLKQAKEKAFGKELIDLYDREIAALRSQIKVLENKQVVVKKNLLANKQSLQTEFNAQFDEYGILLNEKEILESLDANDKALDYRSYQLTEVTKVKHQDNLERAKVDIENKRILANNTEDETEKNRLLDEADAMDEEYNKLERQYRDEEQLEQWAIEQAEKTAENRRRSFERMRDEYQEDWAEDLDLPNQIEEAKRIIVQSALDSINTQIEFKVTLNENSLEYVEWQLSKIEDDAYKASEGLTLLTSTFDTLKDNAELAYKGFNDVLWEYREGETKDLMEWSDVLRAAQETVPKMIEALQGFQEYDQKMMEYYENTLSKFSEKFTKINSLINNSIDQIDSYKSLMSLIGKEQDYQSKGIFLRNQHRISDQQVRASRAYAQAMEADYKALQDRYNAEKDKLDQKQLEQLEKNLLAAKEMNDEAQSQYLSDLEKTGNIALEILDNDLAEARKKLEEGILGSTLEDYMSDLDKLNAKQELYLTETNKLYETNKLIRKAQMDMDKTTNIQAKKQYNDFVKRIEQLKKGNELSAFELSIVQAEYEVLQAKIALEEAQNAKDTVRLTRDSEGNFGYVYTANQDKIAEAEQNLADKENELYNIGLDGAKEYQEMSAAIMQEALEDQEKIHEKKKKGEYESDEEYRKALEDSQQYYAERLRQVNDLYHLAHTTLVDNSYSKEADYILKGIVDLEDYNKYTNSYLNDCEQAFTDYGNNTALVTEAVDKELKDLKDDTNEVLTANKNLAAIITDSLVPEMSEELRVVREITSAWGAQRDELYKEVIPAYEELITQLTRLQQYGMGIDNTQDYAQQIIDLMTYKGLSADDPEIQRLLAARWKKMGGKDTDSNYKAIMEGLDPNSAEYKAYEAMRNYKIQQMGPGSLLLSHVTKGGTLEDAWGSELVEMFKNTEVLKNTDFKHLMDSWLNAGGNETDAIYKFLENKREEKKQTFNLDDNGNAQETSNTTEVTTATTEVTADQAVITMPEIDQAILSEALRQIKEETGWDVDENSPIVRSRYNILMNKQKNLGSYDTGGYTGAWGPEGKLAMLHEKELVLNADDTKNFLSGINMLREISSILDRNALLAGLGLMGVEASYLSNEADKVLQQEVTIHADFPNVTDHNEIEIAIDNLINAASQHAFKV